jgi:hypothetical protein
MTSQRVIIVTVAAEGLELFQIDVANAYLNGVIDAQIYMRQPTGFEDKCYPNLVWELLKSLYGLKQAGNIWNAAIHSYILEIGFTRTSTDLCIYTITFLRRDHMIIAIHVDDFLITSNKEHFQWLVKTMKQQYKISHHKANLYLGIKIERTPFGKYSFG